MAVPARRSPDASETAGRGPANFREADLRRAIRAMASAGLSIGRVVIEGGTITIIPGPAEATADPAPGLPVADEGEIEL